MNDIDRDEDQGLDEAWIERWDDPSAGFGDDGLVLEIDDDEDAVAFGRLR